MCDRSNLTESIRLEVPEECSDNTSCFCDANDICTPLDILKTAARGMLHPDTNSICSDGNSLIGNYKPNLNDAVDYPYFSA